jgi:molybdate transport system regulatory protein
VRYEVLPRIRIVDRDGDTIAIGPGKADLLEAIARNGSIRAAAEELGMSYMRAWTLVRTMNAAFASPLVEKTRGGTQQGGAALTGRGRDVLAAYRAMEKTAARAIAPEWKKLRRHLGR